jgi:hypothetical protein
MVFIHVQTACFHDEYLQAFNQDNVSLIDTNAKGVERISENGVVANGEEYPVDILAYSTGFLPGNPLERFSGITITGRGGQTLEEKFKDGPITLHGLYTRGFPNYFMFQTTQSGVNANFTYTIDTGSQHVASLVAKCKKEGIKSVEPKVNNISTVEFRVSTLKDLQRRQRRSGWRWFWMGIKGWYIISVVVLLVILTMRARSLMMWLVGLFSRVARQGGRDCWRIGERMGSWKGWKGVTVMTIKCLENREIELQKFALQKQDITFRSLNTLKQDSI